MAGILDSFLGSLGQGLQTAGGILSPDVYQNQVDQQKTFAILKQRQAEQQAQSLQQAVQNGSITPEQYQQGVAQLGQQFQALQGIGPTMQTQAAQQSLKANQAATQWLAQNQGGLTPSTLANIPPAILGTPAIQNYLKTQELQKKLERPQMPEGMRVDPSKVTPDSWQKYVQTGKYSDLVFKTETDKPQSTIGKLSADLKAGRISQKEYDLELKKMTNITNVNVSMPMSEDAMDLGARQYLATGQMPPMGMGKAGAEVRTKIMEKAAQIAKSQGTDLSDIPAQRAQFKSNSTALSALTKDVAALEPYKKMLDLNGNIAIDLGKKIQNTNAAIANKPINWLKQNASNNPDVAEYMFQINTLQAEAARVLNNPRLVGQMSYEATKDMQQVLNGNMPIPAAERVIRRMQTDGANRLYSMHKKQQDLTESLRGNPVAKAAEPQPKVVDFGSLK